MLAISRAMHACTHASNIPTCGAHLRSIFLCACVDALVHIVVVVLVMRLVNAATNRRCIRWVEQDG